MINRRILYGVLAPMLITSYFFYSSPVSSGVFDMFSFLFKKSAPSSVNEIVGSSLSPVSTPLNDIEFKIISSFGDKNRAENLLSNQFNLSMERVVVTGTSNGLPQLERTDFVESGDRDAYIVKSEQFPALVIANGFGDDRIMKLFLMEDNQLAAKSSIKINTPGYDSHFSYVSQAEVLPNQQAVLAMAIGDNERQLHLVDLKNHQFEFLANIEGSTAGHKSYFEVLEINNEAALVVYFTETKREKAEFYLNYYQHIMLFNKTYPKGIEILKLGIDDGNLLEWAVKNNILYMNTFDNRKLKKDEKQYTWSLDLNKLLNK
jgi:hypothetical protein